LKARVRILRRAQADLLEIRAYLAREAPTSAAKIVGAMIDDIAALEDHPLMGARPKDERLRDLGFRFRVSGGFLVLYKASRTLVRVYRVIHGRRAYRRLL
jgi:plasmid stabilization system protein ParE